MNTVEAKETCKRTVDKNCVFGTMEMKIRGEMEERKDRVRWEGQDCQEIHCVLFSCWQRPIHAALFSSRGRAPSAGWVRHFLDLVDDR